MKQLLFLKRGLWAAMAACLTASLLPASSVYITGWVPPVASSGNNIYTNLNEQFPNTGAGTPGSEIGVANASYIYNPATYTSANFVAGSNSNAASGISFDIASNATGQDFDQLNGATLSINAAPFNVSNPTAVYLLTAEYFGGSYSVTFTGSLGATQTFSASVPDFCNGGVVNSSSGGVTNVSVLEVQDVGACGSGNSTTGGNTNYFLYEQGFTLNNSFAGQTLAGISITNTGGTTLVLGATASEANALVGTVPEPASALLLLGPLAALGLLKMRRTQKQ
jgi:hypothetical protein